MIKVTGYPSGFFYQKDTLPIQNSNDIVSLLIIEGSEFLNDDYFIVDYNNESIRIDVVDECRYTPLQVHFINKEGAQQVIPFYKAQTESMSVTSEMFESDSGQPINGNHQFVKFNVNAKTTLKANTGFVDESFNEVFKQLMLSEAAWIYDNEFIPINIKSTNLAYKTRQKDRLINYEIEFEYAFNEINNL